MNNNIIFAKKGPLSRLWVAGTSFKRISKTVVLKSNVNDLCSNIENPGVQLTLPTRGRLILGVARILEKKIHYIYMDAVNAKLQLRQIQNENSKLNLPENKRRAKSETITYNKKKNNISLSESDNWIQFADNIEDMFLGDDEKEEILRAVVASVDDVSMQELESFSRSLSKSGSRHSKSQTLNDEFAHNFEKEMSSIRLDEMDEKAFMNVPELPDIEVMGIPQGNMDAMSFFSMGNISSVFQEGSSEYFQEEESKEDEPMVRRHKTERLDRVTQITKERMKSILTHFEKLLCERPLLIQVKQQIQDFEDVPCESSLGEELIQFWVSYRKVNIPYHIDSDSHKSRNQQDDRLSDMFSRIGSIPSDDLSLGVMRDVEYREEFSEQPANNYFLGHCLEDIDTQLSLKPPKRRMSSVRSHSPVSSLSDISIDLGSSNLDEDDIKFSDDETISYVASESLARSSSKLTKIFNRILQNEFNAGGRNDDRGREFVFFEDVLNNVTQGRVNRSDASRAFLQILILSSMDHIQLDQIEPFAHIRIYQ